jgi:hypothetical protein
MCLLLKEVLDQMKRDRRDASIEPECFFTYVKSNL